MTVLAPVAKKLNESCYFSLIKAIADAYQNIGEFKQALIFLRELKGAEFQPLQVCAAYVHAMAECDCRKEVGEDCLK